MQSVPEYDESLLAAVIDEITDRCHRHEPVDLDAYVDRYPALASVLNHLLPAIEVLANGSYLQSQSEHLPHPEPNLTSSVNTGGGARADQNLNRVHAADSQTSTDPMVGDQWQEYEILKKLGQGGMGVVYQGRQHKLDRVVALKILKSKLSDSEHSSRFRAEARAIARIDNRHIVKIFDVGEHHGRPFLALEYCEGGSLAAKVDNEPQSPTWAAATVLTLAKAVSAAHDAGVIHRDLKPANVLLTADQTPKLVDFGLAKQLDLLQDQTHTGVILGTPSYMAPEQTLGDSKQVTAAVDIYALGAILYELLVGRLCWHPSGQFLAILNLEGRADAGIFEVQTGTQISKMASPSSMLLEAGFTDSGDVFFTRTNQRLARFWDPWTGRQLLELYQVRLLRGEHGLLRVGNGESLEQWELSVSGVLRTLPPQQVDHAKQVATWSIPAPQISSNSRFLFCDFGDSATRVWDLERNASAGTIYRDQMSLKSHGTLVHTTRDEILLTNRRNGITAWNTNWVTGELTNPKIYVSDARSNGMALSQDGTVFISRDAQGQWLIASPEAPGKPRHTLEANGFATISYGDRMALSHNGRWAAFGYAVSTYGTSVHVYDTHTGKKVTELELGGQIAFDPLDRWLIAMTTGTMQFVSTTDWKVVRETRSTVPSFIPKQLSFTADGSIMALDVGPGKMQLRQASNNDLLADLISPNTDPTVSRISPDGNRLVAVGEQVQVWDLRRLRKDLQQLQLDWDAPALTSEPETLPTPARFRLVPCLQSLEYPSEAQASEKRPEK